MCPVGLAEQFIHELTVDVGKAEVPALEAVGQLGMVETEQVENGGV